MPRVFLQIPMCGAGGLAGARCGVERSSAPGPTGPGAAVVRPRQPDARHLHRQLPRRPGPARRETRERRSGRRRPDRVCRRARTSGRRLHPIHLRRSSQAGPHRDCRRPRGGIRAQASTGALSRHAAPVRVCRSAISARRAAWRERDRRRGRQRFSSTRRRHPAAAPRDQAGVHGDGVRTARPILASRARGRSSSDFTTG